MDRVDSSIEVPSGMEVTPSLEAKGKALVQKQAVLEGLLDDVKALNKQLQEATTGTMKGEPRWVKKARLRFSRAQSRPMVKVEKAVGEARRVSKRAADTLQKLQAQEKVLQETVKRGRFIRATVGTVQKRSYQRCLSRMQKEMSEQGEKIERAESLAIAQKAALGKMLKPAEAVKLLQLAESRLQGLTRSLSRTSVSKNQPAIRHQINLLKKSLKIQKKEIEGLKSALAKGIEAVDEEWVSRASASSERVEQLTAAAAGLQSASREQRSSAVGQKLLGVGEGSKAQILPARRQLPQKERELLGIVGYSGRIQTLIPSSVKALSNEDRAHIAELNKRLSSIRKKASRAFLGGEATISDEALEKSHWELAKIEGELIAFNQVLDGSRPSEEVWKEPQISEETLSDREGLLAKTGSVIREKTFHVKSRSLQIAKDIPTAEKLAKSLSSKIARNQVIQKEARSRLIAELEDVPGRLGKLQKARSLSEIDTAYKEMGNIRDLLHGMEAAISGKEFSVSSREGAYMQCVKMLIDNASARAALVKSAPLLPERGSSQLAEQIWSLQEELEKECGKAEQMMVGFAKMDDPIAFVKGAQKQQEVRLQKVQEQLEVAKCCKRLKKQQFLQLDGVCRLSFSPSSKLFDPEGLVTTALGEPLHQLLAEPVGMRKVLQAFEEGKLQKAVETTSQGAVNRATALLDQKEIGVDEKLQKLDRLISLYRNKCSERAVRPLRVMRELLTTNLQSRVGVREMVEDFMQTKYGGGLLKKDRSVPEMFRRSQNWGGLAAMGQVASLAKQWMEASLDFEKRFAKLFDLPDDLSSEQLEEQLREGFKHLVGGESWEREQAVLARLTYFALSADQHVDPSVKEALKKQGAFRPDGLLQWNGRAGKFQLPLGELLKIQSWKADAEKPLAYAKSLSRAVQDSAG